MLFVLTRHIEANAKPGANNNSSDHSKKTATNTESKDLKPVTPKNKTEKKKAGPLSWITELVDEGFFASGKSSVDILGELASRSHVLKASDITLPLQTLCHNKRLRRKLEKAKDGNKKVFHWYNW